MTPHTFLTKHLWLAILTAAFAIHLTGFREGHEWGADYAWNWAQAKALVQGTVSEVANVGAFRLHNMPDLIVGPAVYPWGYPAILAAGHALWGDNLTLMKLYMLAFYAGGWTFFYLFIKDRSGPVMGALLMAIVAFGPAFFAEKDHLRSEAPFFLFFMLSIYLMSKPAKTGGLALLGVVIFLAYWTRTHGITLLGALFALQIFRQQFNVVPYLIFGALWGTVQLIPGDTSYLGSGHLAALFENPLEVLWRNVLYYLRAPGSFFDLPKFLKPFAGLFIYGVALVGMWRRREADLALILACVAYASILAPYPFRQTRFLFPIMPFLLYFVYQGIPWKRLQIPLVTAIATACLLVSLSQWVSERFPIEGPYSPEATEFFEFVKTTPADSIFQFWKPRSLTFYANRRAFMRTIKPCPANYIAVYNTPLKTANKRNAALREFVAGQKPVFENRKFSVFPTSCP
jgi:hypothetical protein